MAATGEADAGSARLSRRDAPRRPPLIGVLARNLEAEQERWFLWLPVVFGVGIAAYFALPVEPPLLVAASPVAAALVVRWVAGRSGVAALVPAVLVALTSGFAAAKLRTEAVRAPVLQRQIGPVDVRGVVELVEPRATKGQRLTIRVGMMERLEAQDWPLRVRVRTMTENHEIKPGDPVRLKATLSPPPGPSLPGDYDFARAAWFQGLGAVGYATTPVARDDEAGTKARGLGVGATIERARQAIGRRILAALPGQTGAIANALITGERGGIAEATNQAFRDSGLFHILSISGLHMVIMAGAVFASIRLLLAAIPSIALNFPIKKWAAAAAMVGALCYLLISGSAFATVRSYVMISIMFLAVLLDRPAVALRNVALAALGILVIWPESLLDPGFQMSFAAVVSLVSAYEWLRARAVERAGPPRRGLIVHALVFFGGIITSTLVASLAVAPFGIYHFHNTQQFAILANLIAIPICNIVVMPAALGALVAMPLGVEALPLHIMGWGIEAMVWCATAVARLPGAVGRVPAIPTYALALIIVGGLWCTLWGTRWRLLGLVPIVLGLMLAPTAKRPDVLIGRDAALVAVRDASGALSALSGRGSSFELGRWLEHDGDGRAVAEVAKAQAFRCDALGCIARVKGALVAVATSPAAARDDCGVAGIVVLKFSRPRGCAPSGVVIDVDDVGARGAHALYLDRGRVRIETVADIRGDRPWASRRHSEESTMSSPRLADEYLPARGHRAQ
ncbi:MAG: ComEC/Rec2 family competence protein [Hyphomicrobiaceae bacterium]|nr:MAG: ComEC/Rec2 family competence protein [Hyphomicrobiaceae bacterium]